MASSAPKRGVGWRIAVAAFVLVLAAMTGAAVVFLALGVDVVRDEVLLRQRGQVAPATVLEISRSERRKNLPARVVLAYVGPQPDGRVEVRGATDGVDTGAVVPVLYDPQDPSRARIATLWWPAMDISLLLLGAGVSAALPVGLLRVWLRGGRARSMRQLASPEGGAR